LQVIIPYLILYHLFCLLTVALLICCLVVISRVIVSIFIKHVPLLL
jgi:hypothetical protein